MANIYVSFGEFCIKIKTDLRYPIYKWAIFYVR